MVIKSLSQGIERSLKLRIFFSLAAFYLAALASLTYLTVRWQRNLILEEMTEKAKAGITLMELGVATPLYKLDITRLNTAARQAKSVPNVEFAYIYDAEGRIVGDFNENEEKLHSFFTDPLGRKIIQSNEVLAEIDYQKGILDISRPVFLGNQRIGGIRLGFNLNPMIEEMRAVTFKALGISAGILLAGLLVIFGIANRMTRPIERLTEGIRHIEAGDYQYRVSLKRGDEIGRLASAFDRMADRLMNRETELKKSQSIIRRADRLSSLGMLTAGLAHEIRNPLVAIRTFTQLLPERYQEPEFRNNFQGLALKEVDRICGLINDLLSFARPSAPNVSAEDVNQIVESTVRILESEAKEKEIQIYRRLATNLPEIFIDKEQIKQVLMNVILNAFQSIEGRGVVEVSTRLLAKNGSGPHVQIEIRDFGMGIPEKNLEDIFNPFFTTKKDGNGLGLSISNQIVQEHGGHIIVESQVGKGTSFFINLPVRPPNHQVKVRPQAHEEDSGS